MRSQLGCSSVFSISGSSSSGIGGGCRSGFSGAAGGVSMGCRSAPGCGVSAVFTDVLPRRCREQSPLDRKRSSARPAPSLARASGISKAALSRCAITECALTSRVRSTPPASLSPEPFRPLRRSDAGQLSPLAVGASRRRMCHLPARFWSEVARPAMSLRRATPVRPSSIRSRVSQEMRSHSLRLMGTEQAYPHFERGFKQPAAALTVRETRISSNRDITQFNIRRQSTWHSTRAPSMLLP